MASAEQLLREIHSESLQQLLLSVQEDSQPPISTGVPALDSYFTRESSFCLRSGDVLHIQGPSGSGKTHLLYFLLATCTIPSKYLSSPLGGWNKLGFIFDMDGTFSVRRFHDVLADRLQKSLPFASTASLVEQCMTKMHVFRPASSEQLAVTLAYLPKYHAKHFPDTQMGMVAIHSIDAFYWLDRFKAEQLDGPTSSSYQNVATKLEDLRRSHGVITILTHWGLPQNNPSFPSGMLATHDPPNVPQPDVNSIPHYLHSIPITCQICLHDDFRFRRGDEISNETVSRLVKATIRTVGQTHEVIDLCEITNSGLRLT